MVDSNSFKDIPCVLRVADNGDVVLYSDQLGSTHSLPEAPHKRRYTLHKSFQNRDLYEGHINNLRIMAYEQ